MKILYVITSTTLGGAEKALFEVVTRLDRKRFTPCAVISLKPEGVYAQKLRGHGIAVESLDMPYLPLPFTAEKLAALIDKYKPDIVHAFMYRAMQFTRAAKKKAKTNFRLITSPHLNFAVRAKGLLLVDSLRRDLDDLVLCESENTAKAMREMLGYPAEKIKIARVGINTAPWNFSPEERAAQRVALGLKETDFMVFNAGRLSKQKGQIFLVRAMTLLKNRPEIKCFICGQGEEHNRLAAEIVKLGVQKTVTLTGPQPELAPWFYAADMFALPSLYEGLPAVLLEAMASRLACAATPADGVREIIKDGENALLFEARNPQALAAAITRLADDTVLRTRLAEAGEHTVKTSFGIDTMVRLHEAAYAAVCHD